MPNNAAGPRPQNPAPRFSVVFVPAGGSPGSLLDFLAARFSGVPREVWRERFAGGAVLGADGAPLDPEQPARQHLEVRYFREAPAAEPYFGPLEIVFRSAHLVVADKPPFQPVVPSGPWVRSSLLYQLAARLAAEGEPAEELAPLHRLDRATCGLVLFSRRAATRGLHARLFEERRVEKTYEAFAALPQAPAQRFFTVSSRIVPGEPFFRMREEEGKPNAESEIELVEILEQGGLRLGRFELRPVTGKKHQLRLHMARLGYPILGDRWYPDLLPEEPDDPARPLYLLARALAFEDPLSGDELRFESRRWG